jgi:hypothetical protein
VGVRKIWRFLMFNQVVCWLKHVAGLEVQSMLERGSPSLYTVKN